ncbi:MAG: hypothetical protein GKS01_13590 [Alphaproteobacteria bacterium]|nr:hypothetical protein [Alphaproteobacteria bacterium]
MPNFITTPSRLRNFARSSCIALAAITVAACAGDMPSDPLEGIGYRQARFNDISQMREYRNCRDEGFALDQKARTTGSFGTYIASARVLERCETEVGPESSGIARDERMRAYAVSIQNFFKGGDVDHSRENFDKFKKRFPKNDFYYADGSSFVVTMESLLKRKENQSFGEFSALNVSDNLKSEMRRIMYWKNK